MKKSPEEIQYQLSHYMDRLKRAGVKITQQRLEIFQEIAKSPDHPDAETIFKKVRARVPSISLDTVYRTLWLLLDYGLITTLGSPRERIRFDGNMKPHHHFVCRKCGMVRDFYSHEFNSLQANEQVEGLGAVESSHVEFQGLCLKCLQDSG